jgi:hypothetical protein
MEMVQLVERLEQVSRTLHGIAKQYILPGVINFLYHIVFIAHNIPIFGCVGTVQVNCVNFSQFGCYRSLGHEEPGASPLLPKVNLCPYAMSVRRQ